MQLKTEPKRPHHYIIGVAVKSMRSSDPGKMYMKYGPVYFTNDDVSRVRDAKVLSEDRLFKTSSHDALEINECSGLVGSISAMKYVGCLIPMVRSLILISIFNLFSYNSHVLLVNN